MTLDHGTLSPSGRISNRMRKATIKKAKESLARLPHLAPVCPQPSMRVRLLRQAHEFRDLAARGMSPKKYTAEAERLEALALKEHGT